MKSMKKVLCVLLSVLMMFTLCAFAFAGDTFDKSDLKFNSDGKFKIMQLNDLQDRQTMNKHTKAFIEGALKQEKPDLVVVNGDVLSDMFIGASKKTITQCINNLCDILDNAKTPFTVAFGNHDHDQNKKVSMEAQMEIYKSHPYFVWAEGANCDTFNFTIKSSDGTKDALNIYIMDSNNTNGKIGGYEGVHADQVNWLKAKSAELKAKNGGVPMPSLLFQHVPMKEIYGMLKKVTAREAKTAVYSTNDSKWYALDPAYIHTDDAIFGEAPCSESFDIETGEYQAILEDGDIIGAWFAHDHVNNFYGTTKDGIKMGYNGGTGFGSYGNGDQRSVRIFELDESNVSAYTTRSVYYKDIVGPMSSYYTDILGTHILTIIFRFFLTALGIAR